MTALSIPERAREIARKHGLGWDGDKEWIHDTRVIDALTEMAHSERELCQKELKAEAAKRRSQRVQGEPCSLIPVYEVLEYAAKLLREGGQK